MTTASDIISYARTLARTDSNGLTDAVALTLLNGALHDMTKILVDNSIDAVQTREAYLDSVAGTGTYLWPSDMFKLKTIEVNFTDTQTTNYIQATQIDVSNLPGDQSFDDLRANQPNTAPLFDDRGDWFEIFPTPQAGWNTTRAFRIFYFLIAQEFASTSSPIAYPFTLDPDCLSKKVAAMWARSRERFDQADKYDAEFMDDVKRVVRILQPGTQQPTQTKTVPLTGWEF